MQVHLHEHLGPATGKVNHISAVMNCESNLSAPFNLPCDLAHFIWWEDVNCKSPCPGSSNPGNKRTGNKNCNEVSV